MAHGPKIATTPLELLTADPNRQEPLLNKVWGPMILASLTFAGVCFGNAVSKRPMLSGIQKHVFWCSGAALVGKVVEDYRRDYLAERDAILRHYVELHPEDFPPFERKKYADVLESWTPIR